MKAGCIYVSYPFPNANGHYIQELNITPDVTITLFDFDFCGNCLLALDSSYYLLHTVVDAFYKKRENFLADYESISEISDDGKRVLPMMGKSIYLYYIGGQCDRFGNWSNVFLNELYVKRMIILGMKRWFSFNKPNAEK